MTWLAFTTNTQDGYGAYAIQMRAPMPTTSSSTIVNDATPPLTSWSWGNNNSSGRDGGGGDGGSEISSGAAAGIGIAAALAGIGAGLLVFMAWNRWKRFRNEHNSSNLETREEGTGDHGSWGSKTVPHDRVLEMGNKNPEQPEMGGQDAHYLVSRQHEIDGSNIAELSG